MIMKDKYLKSQLTRYFEEILHFILPLLDMEAILNGVGLLALLSNQSADYPSCEPTSSLHSVYSCLSVPS